MKLTVEEEFKIEDGVHEGVIVAVEYREKPYAYTDIVIEFMAKDKPLRLKAGYPTFINPSSKLARLLTKFGMDCSPGSTVDPDDIVGSKVTFQTLHDGKYANVLPESVKPSK